MGRLTGELVVGVYTVAGHPHALDAGAHLPVDVDGARGGALGGGPNTGRDQHQIRGHGPGIEVDADPRAPDIARAVLVPTAI